MNVGDKEKNTCTGCGACAAVCDAIAMIEDEKGFPYPFVDIKKCNNCGLCINKCPQEKEQHLNECLEIYAFKHESEEVRSNSTSGGAFTALSDAVLKENGVVYGAVFNNGFSVGHIRATNTQARDRMRGSKYVKSNISTEIYHSVKEDLLNYKKVLFSGTPCQIAGLNAFLNKKYSNLTTVDLVCHGTPSNQFFSSYLKDIEKRTRIKIDKVQFRSKITGWRNSKFILYRKNGKTFPFVYGNIYMEVFQKQYSHSSACFECKYCSYDRVADITIADFWGIEKSLPEIDDDKGISLVLVNTLNGKNFFEQATNNSLRYISSKESCKQDHLLYPPQKPEKYEKFWEELLKEQKTYKTALKYSEITYKDRLKDKLRPILKKIGVLK